MGNSVSQPTEMWQNFLAISLFTDYYSESKDYISYLFIRNNIPPQGNEGKDRMNSVLYYCNTEHHRTFCSDQSPDSLEMLMLRRNNSIFLSQMV